MKVNVIGTACTWFERNNTSFILDDKILFDVPEGAYKDIIKLIDIFSLKFIFISHIHTDHAVDLHIIATRFLRERYSRLEKLRVYAPKEMAETIVKFNTLFNGSEEEKDLTLLKNTIDFIDLYDGLEFVEGNYEFRVKKMDHGKCECFGLMVKDKISGKVYAFSADTKDCEALREMLLVSDFAFVDMAATGSSKSHLTDTEFVELSKKYPNCKMFPVHTCDKCQEFAIKNNLNFLEDGQILNI